MNNESFRKLVRDRAQIKSTKQIAREAVEDEFQRNNKKKRKRGGGGDSSAEEEEDEEGENDRRGRPKRDGKEQEEEEDESANKYRDRAKERREGKVDATMAVIDETTSNNDTTRAGSVPLKGLDRSLARKVKKELQTNNYEPTESSSSKPGTIEVRSLSTAEESKRLLREFVKTSSSDHSTVVVTSGILEYLGQLLAKNEDYSTKTVEYGVAGRTLQRSRLALALNCHPANITRAWEAPREITNPNHSNQEPLIHRPPQLGSELISRIKLAFINKSKKGWTNRQDTTVGKNSETQNSDVAKANGGVPNAIGDESDCDDEDIFGGLNDYVPPAPKDVK
jgi:hypothetical protein